MKSIAVIEEILFAFENLSEADLIALRKSAAVKLGGTRFTEPTDLIYEALTRCLDGRRLWPKHVPFTVFLMNVMKSIAHADRNGYSARHVESIGWDDESYFLRESLEGQSRSAEEECILIEDRAAAEIVARELEASLRDDDEALATLTGWLAGMSAKDIMIENQLDLNSYEAARKRLARKVKAKSEEIKALRSNAGRRPR